MVSRSTSPMEGNVQGPAEEVHTPGESWLDPGGRAKLHHTAGSAGSDQPAATYRYDVFTRLMTLGWDLSAPLKLCVVNPKD